MLAIVVSGLGLVAFEQFADGPATTWIRGEGVADPPPGPFESDATWTDLGPTGGVARDRDAGQGPALAAMSRRSWRRSTRTTRSLVADLTRRYTALHAMGPGVWNQAIRTPSTPVATGAGRPTSRSSYCFGPPTCSTVPLVAGSEWSVKGNRVVLVKLDPTGHN